MVNIKKKFTRRGTRRHSKLGRGRKKKQKWRKPKGRDNKMRENKKSRPPVVSVGYRKPKDERGKINGKIPVRVENIKDAKRVKKDDLVIIASIGRKKRLKIEDILEKRGAEIHNKKDLKKSSKKSKEGKSKNKKKSKKKEKKSKKKGKKKPGGKK